MSAMTLFFILTLSSLRFSNAIPEGYVQYERGCAFSARPGFKQKQIIKTETPYSLSAPLPLNFSWDDQNGISLVTSVRNQGLPHNCGSCFAFASVGALSDRLRIQTYRATNRVSHAIDLSVQFALDICQENSGLNIDCGSCNGGSANLLYEALSIASISDESCNPYQGMQLSYWGELGYQAYVCRNCDRFGVCNYTDPNPALLFNVDEHGVIDYRNLNNLTMVEAMQYEIYNRGPIACGMYAHSESFENYKGGILTDATKYPGITHDIVVLGWGVNDQGLKYWIVRNSQGTSWGGPQQGFFLAQRGIDIFNMEQECYWATIKKSITSF